MCLSSAKSSNSSAVFSLMGQLEDDCEDENDKY